MSAPFSQPGMSTQTAVSTATAVRIPLQESRGHSGQLSGPWAVPTVRLKGRLVERLLHLAGGYGSLCKAEHVGAFGVLGTAVALVGWQCAIGVNLSFEPS